MTALQEFAATPIRVRGWFCAAVVLAITLSLTMPPQETRALPADLLIAFGLVLGSVLNVEVGRLFEGGRVHQQRPHKALSAWPMAATVLLPSYYLVPIVALIYAHARWRGLRVTLWKWIVSACFLVCAGAVAGAVMEAPTGVAPTLDSGLPGVLLVVAGVLTFLAVESAMLGVSALINTREDEVWLRRTLVDNVFYVTEAGVITLGALTGLIAAASPWFLLLLAPAYGFLQQSVLHRPLRDLAARDPKTGLLHFSSWQRLANEQLLRLNTSRRPWAVLFADIDNFRAYNHRQGHLGGDRALDLVAKTISKNLRRRDILARFGGEEFCVLLPDTSDDAGVAVAERLRLAVETESRVLPEPITVSVGVAAVGWMEPPWELSSTLGIADRALYQAKLSGRNAVRLLRPADQAARAPDITGRPTPRSA